jgi:hypothetical protein
VAFDKLRPNRFLVVLDLLLEHARRKISRLCRTSQAGSRESINAMFMLRNIIPLAASLTALFSTVYMYAA